MLLVVLAPAAFAEDAYVESFKANTIFTDYYAKPTTRIDLDFEYLAGTYGDASVDHGGMIIGPWNSASKLSTALWSSNGLKFIVGDNANSISSGQTITADRRFLSIDCHSGKLRIAIHGNATTNEVDAIANGASFTQNAIWPVSLLGASKSTDGSAVDEGQFAKARIYGCKIYEWNETSGEYDLKRNYVPVLRDGQPCLRDSVTGSVARDVRAGAPTLRYGGDIEEVGHGYIQLVATSGNVGINTGYHVKDCSRIELDAALGDASTIVRPMGCWQNASTLRELVWTSGNKVIFFINGNQQTTGLSTDTNRHTFVIDQKNSEGRYYNDGSTVLLKKVVGTTAAASGATSTHPLSIFGDTGNVAGTEWAQSAYGMKCYGLKIYENDILVTNLVPCVKNGYPGFKDLISGEFVSAGKYKNDFVAMGNFIVEGNGGQTARDAYVESDGTQVLNSGYNVTRNSRVEVDFAFTKGNRGFLFGNYAKGGSLRWCGWLDSGPLKFACVGDDGSPANTVIMNPGPGQTRIKAIYDMKNGQGWVVMGGVAGNKVTIANASSLAENEKCTFPMGIFGSLKSADGTVVDTTVINGVMRVYSVRIYEGDATEPAAEFLPYKGAEGVGLYDTKTGKLALKHSSSVADPTIGGMGVDGKETWLVDPTDKTVSRSKSVVLTGKAVGAVSYKWTLNGEAIEGGTDGSLEVSWRKHTKTPDVYSVTPVYDVFGSEVDGEPRTCKVTNVPLGMLIIVR